MTPRHDEMICSECGGVISLGHTSAGTSVVSVANLTREHGPCLGRLLARGETFDERRRRLVRETLAHAHEGPYGMLRALSAREVDYLLGPVLDVLEDVEERHASLPRVVHLDAEREHRGS